MKARFNFPAAVAVAALLATGSFAMADGYHKIEAAAQAKITAAQAVASARKQVGGQAKEVELQRRQGRPAYKVELRNGNQEHTIHIDAVSGQVVGSKMETKWKPVRQTAVSLERALQIAQNSVKGRVIEADRETSRGLVVYKVEILAPDNTPHKVIIDANSGKVLASHIDYDD